MAQTAYITEEVRPDPIRAFMADVCREEFQRLFTDYQELREAAARQQERTEKLTPRDKYLTRQKLADELHVSLPTVDKWVKEGFIPAMRIGSRIFFSRFDVEEAFQKIKSDKYYNKAKAAV